MWREVSEADYFDKLEIMPPAHHDHRGFLCGEAYDYRICTVKGTLCAEYPAYVRIGDTFYGGRNLTLNEFRRLDVTTIRDIAA